MAGHRIVSEVHALGPSNPLTKHAMIIQGAWLVNYRTHGTLWLAPAIALLAAGVTWSLLGVRRPGLAFLASCLTLAGTILTAGIALFPFLMPSSSQPDQGLTVWDASSSAPTQSSSQTCQAAVKLPSASATASFTPCSAPVLGVLSACRTCQLTVSPGRNPLPVMVAVSTCAKAATLVQNSSTPLKEAARLLCIDPPQCHLVSNKPNVNISLSAAIVTNCLPSTMNVTGEANRPRPVEKCHKSLPLLASIATIIASQAVISGAFSITRQAIQLGYLPRLEVRHTSETEIGQVYVPPINWGLLVAVQDYQKAVDAIRQYRMENRGWPWQRQIFRPGILFDWGQ